MLHKIGIVGCGGIAQVHAAALARLENTQLTACADIRPERAQAMAEKYGCRAYASMEEMQAKKILENAVNHGLRDKRGEKRIALKAQCAQDRLFITVEDNGVGMDEATIASALTYDPDSILVSRSIGLRNINA